MIFQNKTLEELIKELSPLSADWMDSRGEATIQAIRDFTRSIPEEVSPEFIEQRLRERPVNLDVIRLFMGLSQDEMASRLRQYTLWNGSYSSFRTRVQNEEDCMLLVSALSQMGVEEEIEAQSKRTWGIEDVLMERYKFQRGRAIKGQKRGRALEDQVEELLNSVSCQFVRGGNFRGKNKKTAKADFSIPELVEPKIVIECKGFEATGSKMTDVLGDVEKILEAKSGQMYFFLVTDGLAWLNRLSDLRALVAYHHKGDVDMIFTVASLDQLAQAVAHIVRHEM